MQAKAVTLIMVLRAFNWHGLGVNFFLILLIDVLHQHEKLGRKKSASGISLIHSEALILLCESVVCVRMNKFF